MKEDMIKANIRQLFINLTKRYEKINTINVGYDIASRENVVYGKVILTEKENDFMKKYLETTQEQN